MWLVFDCEIKLDFALTGILLTNTLVCSSLYVRPIPERGTNKDETGPIPSHSSSLTFYWQQEQTWYDRRKFWQAMEDTRPVWNSKCHVFPNFTTLPKIWLLTKLLFPTRKGWFSNSTYQRNTSVSASKFSKFVTRMDKLFFTFVFPCIIV